MVVGEEYRVTKKIKIHTSPLVEVQITLQGTLQKESEVYYIFDNFKVRKLNVVKIERV